MATTTYRAQLVWNESWSVALDDAVSRAKAFFPEKHAERIEKARAIVTEGRVLMLRNGDAIVESDESMVAPRDTTQKPQVVTYTVESGHCTCPDAQYRGPWCKHALARALMIKASEIQNAA